MERVSNYYYNGGRQYFLVNKFQSFDAQKLAQRIRNFFTKKKVPYQTTSPCCGLGDEYFITWIRDDDYDNLDKLLSRFPANYQYGEQSGDDTETYWDCFQKERKCSICKKYGHNKATCEKRENK